MKLFLEISEFLQKLSWKGKGMARRILKSKPKVKFKTYYEIHNNQNNLYWLKNRYVNQIEQYRIHTHIATYLQQKCKGNSM